MARAEIKLIMVTPREVEEIITRAVKQALDEHDQERPLRRRIEQHVLRLTKDKARGSR